MTFYNEIIMKKDFDSMAKVAVIGDSSVGKTNLLLRYVSASYNQTHIATIGIDFKVKTVTFEGIRLKLQIWDTAGQERFRNLTGTIYQGAQAVLLTYAINNRRSFENLSHWLEDVRTFASQNVIVAIAATKCDLEEERAVQKEEGRALAATVKADFFETSAKDNINVEEVFQSLAQKLCKKIIEKSKGPSSGPPKDKIRKSSTTAQQKIKQQPPHKVETKTENQEGGKGEQKEQPSKIVLNKQNTIPPKRKKCC